MLCYFLIIIIIIILSCQEHLSLKKYITDIVVESVAPPESLNDGEERQRSKKKAKKIKARMNSRYQKYPYKQNRTKEKLSDVSFSV